MIFADAVSAVLTIFCIAFLGYVLKRKQLFSDEMAALLPKFLTNIVLPPYLLHSITATFKHDQLLILLSGSLVPFLSLFVSFGIAAFFTWAFAIPEGRRGLFKAAFVTSNTMYIGLPINIALFGNTSIQYVLLYFFASITFFWTVGNYCIAHDGSGKSVKILRLDSLKKIVSPPLVGFFFGLMLVLLDIQLPLFIAKTCEYVGGMTIVLSIMYLGIMFHDIRIEDFRLEKDAILVLLGRFVICPLVMYALSLIWPMPGLMRKVFIIQASLPVMMNMAILTAYYKADIRYATVLVSASTLLTILTIPLFAVLIGYLPG